MHSCVIQVRLLLPIKCKETHVRESKQNIFFCVCAEGTKHYCCFIAIPMHIYINASIDG